MTERNAIESRDNDPLDLLRQELSAVAPSAGFAAKVRESLHDELSDLRHELADVGVSSAFAARVRQSVEERARRRSWFPVALTSRWLVPAAGVAAAAVMVLMWARPADTPAPPQVVAQLEPVAPRAATSSAPQGLPPAVEPGVRILRSQDAPRQRPVMIVRDTAPLRDPMLDVITDQPELLRRLQISIDRADVAVDASEPAGMYQAPKIEVPKVEVSPLSVFLVPDPKIPVGIAPFIFRIAADAAERSSK